jgi:hypothetical protein
MGAVDEGLIQIQLAALAQVLRQRMQGSLQRPIPHPTLKSTVARLVRRVALRHL